MATSVQRRGQASQASEAGASDASARESRKTSRTRRLRRLVAAAAIASLPAGAAAADMINGQRLYGVHCALCHGANGVSALPGAPSFSRGERLMQPDLTLLASIRQGRNAMPGFVGLLRDREILDVISFLRTMQ